MNEAERYLQERLRQQDAPTQTNAAAQSIPSAPQRMVSMWTAWKHFWTRWTFKGRASRSEYWWAAAANFLMSVLLGGMVGVILAIAECDEETIDVLANAFSFVVNVAVSIPYIFLVVRRLHDTNHSGWWWWTLFLPPVGVIALLILLCMRSDPKTNRYGPVPNTGA